MKLSRYAFEALHQMSNEQLYSEISSLKEKLDNINDQIIMANQIIWNRNARIIVIQAIEKVGEEEQDLVEYLVDTGIPGDEVNEYINTYFNAPPLQGFELLDELE